MVELTALLFAASASAGVLDNVQRRYSWQLRGRRPQRMRKRIEDVLREYFAKSKAPVLMNFPVGHQAHNTTLPHGASAELDADRGTLRLLENPVRLE